MRYLVQAMAQYELHVANYYLQRGAYLAAVNRAQTVVRDYPGSPSAQEALRIQVVAYDAMGLKELRDDAERVYQLNYKGNSAASPRSKRAEAAWWKFWN